MQKNEKYLGRQKSFLPHGVTWENATFKHCAESTPRAMLEARGLYQKLEHVLADYKGSPFANVMALVDLLASAVAFGEHTILMPVARATALDYAHSRLEEMMPGARELRGQLLGIIPMPGEAPAPKPTAILPEIENGKELLELPPLPPVPPPVEPPCAQ